MSGARALRLFLLAIATLLWFALGGELLWRFQGNWRLDRLALTKRPAAVQDPASGADRDRALLASVTYRKDVDPAWFQLPPAAIQKPVNQELAARTAANPDGQQQENYIWNEEVLTHPDAGVTALLRSLKVDPFFAFKSYDGTAFPRFRFYPDNDYRPLPWVVNHWGWLSPEVTVRKPSRTVRVGIIGDSTSQNQYGFYLQSYLNAWARASGLDVQFEVLNSARQGLELGDELAALRYELGPMGLDYVYEYFAPRFSLVLGQMVAFATVPAGIEPGKPPPAPKPASEIVPGWLNRLSANSALARRIRDSLTDETEEGLLSEPAKPPVKLRLPSLAGGKAGLDEARKDAYFGSLAGELDRFKSIAAELHTTPLVSTERLWIWDGMELPKSKRALYEFVNGPLFWPFTYAELRQMLDVHNAAITEWASENGVAVVDIDGKMPQSPELAVDAHHDIPISQRMRAWLIFQALIPQIKRDIENHAVPRDNADPSGRHPYLDRPIERLDRQAVLSKRGAE